MVATDSNAQPLALQETVNDLQSRLDTALADRDYYKNLYNKQGTDLYEAQCAIRGMAKAIT